MYFVSFSISIFIKTQISFFLGKKRNFENSFMQEVREEKEEQQPNDLI